MSDPDLDGPRRRLDPERAAELAGARDEPPPLEPEPEGATRRYRWMVGALGLTLVVILSVYEFASHGVGTVGVPPGARLHYFAAPLASSNLNGYANLNPTCTLARHDPRALNICLLAARAPLVLAFFVVGYAGCERGVDALQTLSREFPAGSVQFAAVAIHASHAATAAAVRAHHWTIAVAYDIDGRVGEDYSVEVCPTLELAARGGTVVDRLIGEHWTSSAALAPRVAALIRR